ncbi:MAG: hypothetical protein K2W95_30860 [Candidatus Obscuribacterales bacterium]|nr:hypothetical protein [Candidatus Obscuribacterales bacterium]
MNTHKRMLTLLCLIGALAQPPAANAQAEILVGLGAKLLPMVLPMALSAIPMIPVLIQQYAPPMPKFGWRKKKAAPSAEETTSSETADSDTEGGDIEKAEGSAAAEKPPEKEPEAAPKPEVAVHQRPRPRDSSEWYMDEEHAPVRSSANDPPRTANQRSADERIAEEKLANRRIADKGGRDPATESVKAELLAAPDGSPQPASAPSPQRVAQPVLEAPAPQQQSKTESEHDAPRPTIMMSVPD